MIVFETLLDTLSKKEPNDSSERKCDELIRGSLNQVQDDGKRFHLALVPCLAGMTGNHLIFSV